MEHESSSSFQITHEKHLLQKQGYQIFNKIKNSHVDEYVQNLKFQIFKLQKLTKLQIQHVLEESTNETLIDLVGMPILRNCDGTMTADSAAGDVYTNPDHITILLGTTDTWTIETTIIPAIKHVPKNTIILRFSVTRPFLIGQTIFKLQYLTAQSAEHQRKSTLVHIESSNNGNFINLIIERINSTSTKLNIPPSFSIQLLKPELQVTKLKFQPITHDQTTHISTTAIKSGLRTETRKWMINRFTRYSFNKKNCIGLITIMEQIEHARN
ncbi:MAG: hypothetical protein EZS28_001291 [Streblomastix strix]|uniref:Uncharacterized protein n=1 Tax=Streblomastix strix TaxID=222440 RepID=A0A5J4X9A7_9EUKA|nr:MAG: hypothetical protein EZS28_001291 [Streblomastix strix]